MAMPYFTSVFLCSGAIKYFVEWGTLRNESTIHIGAVNMFHYTKPKRICQYSVNFSTKSFNTFYKAAFLRHNNTTRKGEKYK